MGCLMPDSTVSESHEECVWWYENQILKGRHLSAFELTKRLQLLRWLFVSDVPGERTPKDGEDA